MYILSKYKIPDVFVYCIIIKSIIQVRKNIDRRNVRLDFQLLMYWHSLLHKMFVYNILEQNKYIQLLLKEICAHKNTNNLTRCYCHVIILGAYMFNRHKHYFKAGNTTRWPRRQEWKRLHLKGWHLYREVSFKMLSENSPFGARCTSSSFRTSSCKTKRQ